MVCWHCKQQVIFPHCDCELNGSESNIIQWCIFLWNAPPHLYHLLDPTTKASGGSRRTGGHMILVLFKYYRETISNAKFYASSCLCLSCLSWLLHYSSMILHEYRQHCHWFIKILVKTLGSTNDHQLDQPPSYIKNKNPDLYNYLNV